MMLRPTAATELPYPIPIPIPSAPKDIPVPTSTSKITTTTQSAPTAVPVKPSGSPKTRRTPSFLFDSPPVAPLAPATSNATATSSPPTKTSKSKSSRDSILASPGTSPTNINNNNNNSHHRRSFFPSPTKSSFSSGGSAGGSSSGFAGGIFSLSSLLARMPGSASIIPILSPGSHHNNNRHSISGSTTVTANTRASLDTKSPTSPTSPTSIKAGININNASSRKMAGGTIGRDRVPGATGMTTAEKQEAVRNAQAVLASVRNDWEWAEELRKNKRRKTDDSLATSGSSSTVVTRTSTSSATIAVADPGLGLSDDDEEATDGDTEDDEDEREYRSRYESESDDSRHPKAASAGTKSASRSQQPPSEVYPDDEPKSAYRFHGPDTLGVPVTKEERRARRKKELEEEMQWNEGLRIWVERRDLWTQADKNGRVPIGKSKFEDNPFYHAIVPDAYPQLYSRIIIKSNTPTIPINLQHMTNALVEGWKADGQWPPKPTRPEPSMTRKKNLSLGESMVKRVFGLGR